MTDYSFMRDITIDKSQRPNAIYPDPSDEPFQWFVYGRYIKPIRADLNDNQYKVWRMRKAGYTMESIGERLRLKRSSVDSHIQAIKKKGWDFK